MTSIKRGAPIFLRLNFFFFLIGITLVLSGCTSEPSSAPSPDNLAEAVDIPPHALTAFVSFLENEIEIQIDQHCVPGLAITLVHDGQIAWTRGFGTADRERGTPVRADTRFQVASISKSLTALGELKQVDAGLPAERCPIRLGCRFADHVLKVTEAPQEHSNLVAPLFLLPFLSWALSSAAAGAIEINETKGSALSVLTPGGLREQTGSWPEIASVRLRLFSVNALPKPYPTAKRIDLHPSDQITLAAFATRTLAPETEERRRFGAGGREE